MPCSSWCTARGRTAIRVASTLTHRSAVRISLRLKVIVLRLGAPVLRAAIEAGLHYLDINDDSESTEAMFEMDQEARRRGITAVIGIGASPGMSNLLAVTVMEEPDEVTQIYAGFDLDAVMSETRGEKACAATIHGIHQLTGKIRVFDDGKFVDQRPSWSFELAISAI